MSACGKCESLAWRMAGGDVVCALCDQPWPSARPTQGGRCVYSDTLLPPPSDEAERYLRAATAPRLPRRGLLERVRGAWLGLCDGWRSP